MQLMPGGDKNKVSTITVMAGAVIWRPSETHIVRNAGATTVKVLEVEIINSASEAAARMPAPACAAQPLRLSPGE